MPRAVAATRAFAWFGEAMRLWKRGPLTFCGLAIVVLLASVALEPVAIAGFVSANLLAPLVACSMLYASLAADRGDRPRWSHLLAVFAAPLSAQVAIVGAGLVTVAAETFVAWNLAEVNLLLPVADPAQLTLPSILATYAAGLAMSLPFAFVPMAVLFDGERPRDAFASSLRAFALNAGGLALYACVTFALLIVGLVTSGIGLVVVLPLVSAASYAAWKDIFGLDAGH
jgi:hypothetical protein